MTDLAKYMCFVCEFHNRFQEDMLEYRDKLILNAECIHIRRKCCSST